MPLLACAFRVQAMALPLQNMQNKYRIANNYGTAIFQGDMVKVVTGGGIERYADGGWRSSFWVFSTDAVTPTRLLVRRLSPTHYPASTAAADIEAFVIDSPHAVFEIQADDAMPVADLFGNFDIFDNSPVGDTNSGISRCELDVGTGATTATLPLKAIDISQDPENNDVSSANTNVIVMINNHLFSAGTTGLA